MANEMVEMAEEARETARLLASVERCMKRLKELPAADLKEELLQNTYPLLREVIKSHDRRFATTEEQVVALTEQVDELDGAASILLYEDGAQLAGVLGLAKTLCQGFQQGRPAEEIGQMIEQLEPACDAALQLVSDLTVPEDDEGDDETEEKVQ